MRNGVASLADGLGWLRWELLDRDSHRLKQADRIADAVVMRVVYLLHVTKVDQALGALNARQMRHENDLFDHSWGIAVDDGVLFGMEAAAIARFFAIAAVMQSRGIAVIAHGQDFSKIGACDHGADPQTIARGALGKAKRQIHVYTLKSGASSQGRRRGHCLDIFLCFIRRCLVRCHSLLRTLSANIPGRRRICLLPCHFRANMTHMLRGQENDQLIAEIKQLFRLCGPIMLAHLANMSMQVVDMMFVGRLGAEAMGGVSIGNALFVCFFVVSLGLLLGLDFLVAHAYGSGRRQECNSYLVQAIYMISIAAVPFALIMYFASHGFRYLGITPPVAVQGGLYLRALCWSLIPFSIFTAVRQYLQAMGIAGPITWILILANAVNVLGNWIFVFGHLGFRSYGVAGSGWSTVVSRAFMAGAIVAYVIWRRDALGLNWHRLEKRFSRSRISEIVHLGAPAALQVLLEVGVFATATMLAGRLGAFPLAAHQVVLQVSSITFMVPLGLASAAAVRVGQALGRAESRTAYQVGWLSIAMGAAIMAFFGIILYVFSHSIIRIFTPNLEVIGIGSGLLLIAGFFQLSDGVQVVTSGILRGTGNTRASLIANFVGHWIFGLPTSITFGFILGWGIRGLWIGLSVGLTSVAVMLLVVWARRSKDLIVGKYLATKERPESIVSPVPDEVLG